MNQCIATSGSVRATGRRSQNVSVKGPLLPAAFRARDEFLAVPWRCSVSAGRIIWRICESCLVRKNECHECHECHDKERHSFCHGTRSPMISRWGVLGRRWCAAAPRPEWVAGARLCQTPGLSLSDAARTCTQITEDTDHFKEHDGHDGHAVGPLLLHVPRCSKMFQDVPRCSKMFQDVPRCSKMFQDVPSHSRLSSKKMSWCQVGGLQPKEDQEPESHVLEASWSIIAETKWNVLVLREFDCCSLTHRYAQYLTEAGRWMYHNVPLASSWHFGLADLSCLALVVLVRSWYQKSLVDISLVLVVTASNCLERSHVARQVCIRLHSYDRWVDRCSQMFWTFFLVCFIFTSSLLC